MAEKFKRVRPGVPCPKCFNEVTGYLAKDFTNEKATLVLEHEFPDMKCPDGSGDHFKSVCVKEVSILDAHQFETRAYNKFDFGRKW